MSKFYDETMQSLHQAAEIAKGTLPVAPVEGMPAETYRVTGIQVREIIKELKERLENVPDAYPDFVEGIVNYARKKPERMKAVTGYLSGHPDALSSDIVEFVSSQPDFMEDAAYDEACRSELLEEDDAARKKRALDELNEMIHPINDIDYDEACYRESLEKTEMQFPERKAKIDYKALIRYAKEKGVQPCDLEKYEQEMFVIHEDGESPLPTEHEILIKLANVDRAHLEFIDTVACYARKNPERMRAVWDYLMTNPKANSSEVLGFISSLPDYIEDSVCGISKHKKHVPTIEELFEGYEGGYKCAMGNLTKNVNVFNQAQRKIRCIAREHDYLGDGTKVVEEDLEVGKIYSFVRGRAEAYGSMVFLKEVPSRFGFQSYLFEEMEAYDEETVLKESRKWLMEQLDKGMDDAKKGRVHSREEMEKMLEELRRHEAFAPHYTEGHDPGAAYWIYPVRAEDNGRTEIIEEYADLEISIPDRYFDWLLTDFFVNGIDSEMTMNLHRYSTDYVPEGMPIYGFAWNLNPNLYRKEDMERVIKNMGEASAVLRSGHIEKLPNRQKARLRKTFAMVDEDESEMSYKDAMNLTADFYELLASRLNRMMSDCPQTDIICVMAP